MAFVMMRLTMKTAIMIVESAVALAHRGANVPNVPVLVEMMVLVTVSPTYYSYFSNGVHTVFFFTLLNGIDFMIVHTVQNGRVILDNYPGLLTPDLGCIYHQYS